MEEERYVPVDQTIQYSSRRIMSPEIVEIGEDSNVFSSGRDNTIPGDIYVAVGKDDLDVLKWAVDHVVSPASRIFLVHVYPPITYINTPGGYYSIPYINTNSLCFGLMFFGFDSWEIG